jgi:hypothetical protein
MDARKYSRSAGGSGGSRRWRFWGPPPVLAAIVAAIVVALGSSPASTVARRRPTRPKLLTRYSLVHGCYAVRDGNGRALPGGPFRMQPAALGVYLLYGPHGDYLVGQGGSGVADATSPSGAAEWSLVGSSLAGFVMSDLATRQRLPVRFTPASGCSVYPEAGVNATGSSFKGSSPEGDVLGTAEGHAHVTAFELFGGDWHCGRPWSPFGAPYALPASCSADEQGTNGEVESFVDFGSASRPKGMHGWPTFVDWPSPTALAEEGDYYTGIERAWKAGLRLMVTNLVDNEALCNLMTKRHNPCNDMASVKIQSADLHALQNYVDAESGGPGKGWFRIVTNPFQARKVISQGKLAVVEGIEVSRIFGCGENNGVPQCNEAQINAGLNEVRSLGVSTFFPVHEFDNAFGGTKMIAGELGVLINAGNREETGSFWTLKPCPAQDQDAEQYTVPNSGPLANLLNGPLAGVLHGSPAPVYGPGPQCNQRGLTSLGAYLVNQMIKRHFIIQLDHMDSKTATAALSIATAHHYSGVVSAHCCSSAQLFKRIYADGGFITPPVETAPAFVGTWRKDRAERDPAYHFGFGWGSDMNGLAEQPGPTPSVAVRYPFHSYLGHVTFNHEVWDKRSFDLNSDGLANYGMYADWLDQIQQLGGRPLMNDMFQGAESFLEMWERAYGVPKTRCLAARQRFSASGLGRSIRLGDSAQQALYRAGQPYWRPGRSFRYCVTGRQRRAAAVAAVFNRGGWIALIATTGRGDTAAGVAPGALVQKLHGSRRLMADLREGRRLKHGARYVYGIRARRVRFVALASAYQIRHHGQLRSALKAAGL